MTNVVCEGGVCRLVEMTNEVVSAAVETSVRVAQGYMPADEFVSFLGGANLAGVPEWTCWTLPLVFLGGLAMDLTPCVLPMVPINLMIIGRSAKRGFAYGLGIALAYGLLGVGAALGGLAFGDIQGSPWFNAAVAVVFVGLALALFDVFFIDFSRFRSSHQAPSTKHSALFFSFLMGALSAVLAGACVAPVLISVLLLTADLVAKGNQLAILLPFVMGVGMAFPWPFAGAGMKVLPKPGGWMKGVNGVFGVIVLGFAAWHGWLAWKGWSGEAISRSLLNRDEFSITSGQETASPLLDRLATARRPILVDCWATWCKNCVAMDKVMEEGKVKEALKPFTVIRLQAEDISELRKVKGFESIKGLPAFVIFE